MVDEYEMSEESELRTTSFRSIAGEPGMGAFGCIRRCVSRYRGGLAFRIEISRRLDRFCATDIDLMETGLAMNRFCLTYSY